MAADPTNTFNYLAVLFSIIVGLAATELLQGVRTLVVQRRSLLFYWPALVRAMALLLMLAQTWWAMFGLSGHADWTFGMYGAVLLQITLLYLVTALALPHAVDAPVDMRATYFAQSRPFYLLMLAATAASVGKDVVIDGHLPGAANLTFHGVFAALALAAAASRRDWLHQAVTSVMLLAFVAYVVLLFDHLPG